MVTAAMKLKDTCSLEESYDKSRKRIKKRHHFANKGPYSLCTDVRLGSLRRLSTEELMLLNCAGEDF